MFAVPPAKGDFQVLSDLAPASSSHLGHNLPAVSVPVLGLLALPPAQLGLRPLALPVLVTGTLFLQVVAGFAPSLQTGVCSEDMCSGDLRPCHLSPPPTLTLFLLHPAVRLPCCYLTPDILHIHLFLALLFLTSTGL